uniref:Protein ARV n=1 Tax=Takifugu rubripes TaxID=31033 RepID=A0A674P152_TAKRU
MEEDHFRCVECSHESPELYRDYRNGILKITICDSCKKPVDKYIEYDLVIILIDAILCKTQAFRHILFNTSLNVSGTGLYQGCFLESAPPPPSASVLHLFCICPSSRSTTKEWEFYQMFGLAALELSAFCTGLLLFLWAAVGGLEVRALLRALLLSGYGKVLLIPAVIWEHDYSPLCLGFIKLFVLTSNSQAIRVVLNSSRRLSLLAVCVGVLSEACVSHAARRLPWSVQDVWTLA